MVIAAAVIGGSSSVMTTPSYPVVAVIADVVVSANGGVLAGYCYGS